MKKTMKWLSLLLAASLALGLLASCTPGDSGTSDGGSPASDSDSGAPTGSAEPGVSADPGADSGITGPKEVSVNLGQEPPELNSVLTTSTGSGNVLRHIVEGLVYLDENNAPTPGIAESWDVSDDGLTYTFHLRGDSVWSNGDKVVAEDFIYAWTLLFTADTAAPYAGTWAGIFLGAQEHLEGTALSAEQRAALDALGYEGLPMGFKAIDDATVQVSIVNPTPYLLSVLAFYNFLPMNQRGVEEIGFDQYAKEYNTIITNGMYNMAAWTHESDIVLEKNPNYYGAGAIKIDKITMNMISDSGAAYNAFLAGEIDYILVNPEQAEQLRGMGVDVKYYDDGSNWYFEYNNTLPGLKNVKVRKAMTLGVDVESFVGNVLQNNSTVANSFVPSAISDGAFTAAVGPLIERGDVAAAKALLEEGLAEEGMTIADFKPVLIADDTTTAATYCAFFKEQWMTNLGVDVTVEQMTYNNRIDRMQSFDFSIVLAGWGPDYDDPMTFLDLFVTGSGNNHTQYSNSAYDALVTQAKAEPDAAAREQILIQIEHILAEDMPVGYVYNRARDYVTSERLTGYLATAFTDMCLRYADVVA